MKEDQIHALNIATTETTKNERLENDIIIGKDVLELLTSSMYVNPLNIFREYVQNSVDSIDQAAKVGVLDSHESGQIDIEIDNVNRTIKVRDNGLGVSNKDFEKTLTAFGSSYKRSQKEARGFRGVGRLAGLGYCQELIFRTKTNSDSQIKEMTWNCVQLKSLLADPSYGGSLQDLVKQVVRTSTSEDKEADSSFFEVIMKKVIRTSKNDRLMNPDIICSYISQVAPVPFHKDFSHGKKIQDFLNMNLGTDYKTYNIDFTLQSERSDIFPEDVTKRLYKPLRDVYKIDKTKEDKISKIEFFEVLGNEETAAVGWIAHTSYLGALPLTSPLKGLRIRHGNIQIGEHNLLEEVFTESRFNNWSIGEIHILDHQIKPNGRRDNFEQSVHYRNLLNHLKVEADKLSKICRDTSAQRNRIKHGSSQVLSIKEAIKALDNVSHHQGLFADQVKVVENKLILFSDYLDKLDKFDCSDSKSKYMLFEEDKQKLFKDRTSLRSFFTKRENKLRKEKNLSNSRASHKTKIIKGISSELEKAEVSKAVKKKISKLLEKI